MEYKFILSFAIAAILLAFFTGHSKLAIGIAVFTVVSIIAFYAMVLFALWNWSKQSSNR